MVVEKWLLCDADEYCHISNENRIVVEAPQTESSSGVLQPDQVNATDEWHGMWMTGLMTWLDEEATYLIPQPIPKVTQWNSQYTCSPVVDCGQTLW